MKEECRMKTEDKE